MGRSFVRIAIRLHYVVISGRVDKRVVFTVCISIPNVRNDDSAASPVECAARLRGGGPASELHQGGGRTACDAGRRQSPDQDAGGSSGGAAVPAAQQGGTAHGSRPALPARRARRLRPPRGGGRRPAGAADRQSPERHHLALV